MLIEENWANNEGIRINFFQSKPENGWKTTLLICPGLSESAEEYINLMSSLQDNRCLRDVRVEVFEDAGHDIQTEHFDRFVKVIDDFLTELG